MVHKEPFLKNFRTEKSIFRVWISGLNFRAEFWIQIAVSNFSGHFSSLVFQVDSSSHLFELNFSVRKQSFFGLKFAYGDDISKYIITTPLKRKNCLWFRDAVRANLSAVEGCQSTTCPRYISFIFSRFHFCLVAWIIYMLLPYKIISPSLSFTWNTSQVWGFRL